MMDGFSSGEARKMRRHIMATPSLYPVETDKPLYSDGHLKIYPGHSWSGFDPLPTEKDPPRFRNK